MGWSRSGLRCRLLQRRGRWIDWARRHLDRHLEHMRGWQRDQQRAAFQPTGVATFLITLLALGVTGSITPEIVKLFILGLPALGIGTSLGWKLYGKLDEALFRKGVLVLLLISGVALIAVGSVPGR